MKNKNYENNKVIVAHPNQQHSFQLAEALIDKGLLYKYCTTLYYSKNQFLSKLVNCIPNKIIKNKFQKKQTSKITPYARTFCSLLGLLFYGFGLIDKERKVIDKIYYMMAKAFGKQVAKYAVKHSAKAVVMYDFTATSCFEYLNKKSKKIIKILDMSSIPAYKIRNIIEGEQKKTNYFSNSYRKTAKRYSDRYCRYFQKEILLADYYLAPSTFVRSSLLECGVKEKQIYLVPFGLNTNQFSGINKKKISPSRKLTFLYVGRLEGPKGAYYVLEAFEKLWQERKDFRLFMVGASCGNEKILNKYSEFWEFRGQVLFEKMTEIYSEADVYVAPTLWEGLSFSLLEAMLSGLPAIATECSGAQDVINNNEEGFIIPSKSVKAIYESALWYLNHRDLIPDMSIKASLQASKYTLDKYSVNVADAVKDMLRREP